MTKASSGWFIVASVLCSAPLIGAGCSSSNAAPPATSPSGEVIGPPDSHCAASDGTLTVQPIGVCDVIDPARLPSNTTSCGVAFDQDAGAGAVPSPDAAVTVDAGLASTDYGPTMYGSAGNDDDCKYYVSWISTPIKEHVDTYFTVTALRLVDMQPATCAGLIADVSLDAPDGGLSFHGLPGTPPAPETTPGVYRVGPLPFDQPGTWTVRFHLFEECGDAREDSPHGHAAFFVNVP
jgi:hypothetical protein